MSDNEQVSFQQVQLTLEKQSRVKALSKRRANLKKRVTIFLNFLTDVQSQIDAAKSNAVSRVVYLDWETCHDQLPPYIRISNCSRGS